MTRQILESGARNGQSIVIDDSSSIVSRTATTPPAVDFITKNSNYRGFIG